MAKENPLEEFPNAEPDAGATSDSPADLAIDQQVDGLNEVLKKDAGELPVFDKEGENTMGGADALSTDFGADFAADPEAGKHGLSDPFDLGDAPGLSTGDTGRETQHPAGRDLAAGLGEFAGNTNSLSTGHTGPSGEVVRADIVLDIPVDVQIILGSSRMAVSDLMELSEGETIALDRKIGEPVEISVNGKLIGRGEITVLEADENRFGVRMIEVYGAAAKKD